MFLKKLIIIVMLILVIPISYSRLYGEDIYGVCPYGYSCPDEPPPPIPSPSKPSGGGEQPSSILSHIFPEIPIFGTCSSKEQKYNEVCYPCDPEVGYLYFNPDDASISCISCPKGFILSVNNTCIQGNITQTNVTLGSIYYEISKVGAKLTPQNPRFGTSLIIIFGSTLLVAGSVEIYKSQKRKKEIVEDLEEDTYIEDEEDI